MTDMTFTAPVPLFVEPIALADHTPTTLDGTAIPSLTTTVAPVAAPVEIPAAVPVAVPVADPVLVDIPAPVALPVPVPVPVVVPTEAVFNAPAAPAPVTAEAVFNAPGSSEIDVEPVSVTAVESVFVAATGLITDTAAVLSGDDSAKIDALVSMVSELHTLVMTVQSRIPALLAEADRSPMMRMLTGFIGKL